MWKVHTMNLKENSLTNPSHFCHEWLRSLNNSASLAILCCSLEHGANSVLLFIISGRFLCGTLFHASAIFPVFTSEAGSKYTATLI